MMRIFIILIIVFFLFSSVFSQNNDEFIQVDQWQYDEVFGHNIYSVVNAENELIGGFAQVGNRIITPKKLISFALRGQGPSEAENFYTAFLYKGDFALLERPHKIKVFTKIGDKYVWKETKWLKRNRRMHIPMDSIYFDNKFFFSGMGGYGKDDKTNKFCFLTVYDDLGNLLKQLIVKPIPIPSVLHEMRYPIASYKSDKVYFMTESEMKVIVISSKTLGVIKEVPLELPAFYVKMPLNYYRPQKQKDYRHKELSAGDGREGLKNIEEWDTTYSSIQEIVVDGKYLVVQIRTANPKMKKFAMLFYNAETFKLEKTFFIDDFLLASKDGKFYCFKNGNPGRDDDTESCIINIYSLKASLKSKK